MGFFEKIKAGLTRTRENLGHSFDSLFAGELDDDFYDELEETLILGDMGVETTLKVVEELRETDFGPYEGRREAELADARTKLTEGEAAYESGKQEERPRYFPWK